MTKESHQGTVRQGRIDRSLNGVWQVEPGSAERPPERWTLRAPVPGLVDLTDPLHDWSAADYHWYRTTFEADDIPDGRVVTLRLDQSRFGTAVRLNGTSIGEGIACYTSQEYRIDPVLRRGEPNELLVRVGAKSTLPPESAVGNDQGMTRFIPGIWGNVHLLETGAVRIVSIQILPQIEPPAAEARVRIENVGTSPVLVQLAGSVEAVTDGSDVSGRVAVAVEASPGRSEVSMFFPMPAAKLWWPEAPALHRLSLRASVEDLPADDVSVRFGLREFRVDGRNFVLNGRKIFLRGSSIAFHRFLADPQRVMLPWDREWIRRVLAEIPKEHHFNSFRAHLGPLYDAWYEIADEEGVLLQVEWPFGGVTGTKEQIIREWTDWIIESGNHPSIVLWDATNECTEPMIGNEIVPLMKKLDPTRAWEPADFADQHSWIYSLGPVLNEHALGSALGIHDLEMLTAPLVVNAFLWWWLNPQNYPTLPMEGVVERWLGPNWMKRDLIAHQSFLAEELVGLFRRMEAAVIQPFIYLANGNGPAGHWFEADVRSAIPKPILATLKNAFAPIGVSVELWDRHFFPEEERTIRVFVFNDTPAEASVRLTVSIRSMAGRLVSSRSHAVVVDPVATSIRSCDILFPPDPGTYLLEAAVDAAPQSGPLAVSRKEVFVVRPEPATGKLRADLVYLFSRDGELRSFYEERGVTVRSWRVPAEGEKAVCIVNGRAIEGGQYIESREAIGAFVRNGGTLVVLEPERDVAGTREIGVLPDLEFIVCEREVTDRGGYDSFVFPEQIGHSMWDGIEPQHLRLFNGAYGGEMVSPHEVTVRAAQMSLGRCGLGLKTVVASDVPYGEGRVLLCRIQLRGRLVRAPGSEALYARRPDPVAQQIALNLLSLA